MATFFGRLAATVGDHVTMHDIATARRRQVARDMRTLQGLGRVVAALVDQGRSLDEAVRQLEAQGALPTTTLTYWQKH